MGFVGESTADKVHQSGFSIGLGLLYLTGMRDASLILINCENWKYKQKHSPKTVQNYKEDAAMLYLAAFAWLFAGGIGFVLLILGTGKCRKPWFEKAYMLLGAISVSVYMGVFVFFLTSTARKGLEMSWLWDCIWGTFLVLGIPCVICFIFQLCGFFIVRNGEDSDDSKTFIYACFIYYLGIMLSAWLAIYLGKGAARLIGFGISLLITTVFYLSTRNAELKETAEKEKQRNYANYLTEQIHGLSYFQACEFNDVLKEFDKHGKVAALNAFERLARKIAIEDKTDTQSRALTCISGLTGAMVPNGIITEDEARALSSKYIDELLTNWKKGMTTTQGEKNGQNT